MQVVIYATGGCQKKGANNLSTGIKLNIVYRRENENQRKDAEGLRKLNNSFSLRLK